ncbi:GNAT family N-acetyltransferase [Streptomyces radicis]|uniref:GNAT family N-acetyltransferase n=1 Tax=Streptomyces radicis TaxID=1750517 RepID=A0A3A9W798_9ACTN|nr:GNAT family N-acetyltransferase [Streptomyces radicis]RKN09081.1 GNAT family N-acetyltransferase [Streptomyces radicis]RKN22728.1 GNAT family N-acetyltransferase [Streptomyces radicis]
MHVRETRLTELESLRDIERAAGEPFRAIGMGGIADDEPPGVGELARFVRAGLSWVMAGSGDRPVAYLVADPVDGGLHIEQVSVHPANARRGLGRSLIEHAAAHATGRGLAALTLTTFAEVPWNAPYYERCGFAVLEASALTEGLRAVVARETAAGLGRWPRVCMRRPLRPTPRRPASAP